MNFKKMSLALVMLISSAVQAEVSKENCQKANSDEPIVYSSDFTWNASRADMKEKFAEMYESGKRLKARAFLNEEQVILPIEVYGKKDAKIKLTKEFIQNITSHIEEGLKNKYVEFVMFPDMGHSHFFIPQGYYDRVLGPMPVKEKDKMYELMFAHKDLKILYHTAEQLKMLDDNNEVLNDRHTQWRFYTRNLLGFNDSSDRVELLHQEDHMANTANFYRDGYRYYGAGFNITATKNGCFPYKHKGKTYYFDLSLKDLESKPGAGGGGDYF